MPLSSKYALRVSSIPDSTTAEQYADFVRCVSAEAQEGCKEQSVLSSLKPKNWFRSGKKRLEASKEPSSNQDDNTPLVTRINDGIRASFANQHGLKVGTIAFPSKGTSELVLQRHEKARKDVSYPWRDWDLSSNCQGITVLYENRDEDEDRGDVEGNEKREGTKGREDERYKEGKRDEKVKLNMDICAVHGLGGNAIDTWTASDKGLMWLRDYLPSSEGFSNSRIMTFGYDSDLTDKGTVARLENWAESLLHCLSEVRTSEEEKARPLLFVCHSLGGIVARKAMSQLSISNIKNITLSQCGLVFLATPHTGTTQADWGNFVLAAAEAVAGVRPEVVSLLQSFNHASVWDKQVFLKLAPRPPFRCFAEGRKMLIKRTNQHVVTQASATLDPENPAVMIPQDHSGICKFNSKIGGGYFSIISALSDLFTEVTGRLESELGQEHRVRTGDALRSKDD